MFFNAYMKVMDMTTTCHGEKAAVTPDQSTPP
jgi:hypothetical protein